MCVREYPILGKELPPPSIGTSHGGLRHLGMRLPRIHPMKSWSGFRTFRFRLAKNTPPQ